MNILQLQQVEVFHSKMLKKSEMNSSDIVKQFRNLKEFISKPKDDSSLIYVILKNNPLLESVTLSFIDNNISKALLSLENLKFLKFKSKKKILKTHFSGTITSQNSKFISDLIKFSNISTLFLIFDESKYESIYENLMVNKTITNLTIQYENIISDVGYLEFLNHNDTIKKLTIEDLYHRSDDALKTIASIMKENKTILEFDCKAFFDFSFLKENKTLLKLVVGSILFEISINFFCRTSFSKFF